MPTSARPPERAGGDGPSRDAGWRWRDEPWHWLGYLAPLPLNVVWVTELLRTGWSPGSWVTVLLLAAAYVVSAWLVSRRRVRLTDEGIEVRRFRTRVLRWADITSIDLSPEWESRRIWVRTRGMHPQASADALPVPRGRRSPGDTTVEDAVEAIRAELTASVGRRQ